MVLARRIALSVVTAVLGAGLVTVTAGFKPASAVFLNPSSGPPTRQSVTATVTNGQFLHLIQASGDIVQQSLPVLVGLNGNAALKVTLKPKPKPGTYKIIFTDLTDRTRLTASYTVIDPNASKPAAPSHVTARRDTNTSIRVTWADNATNESGYQIKNVTTGQLVTVGANKTSFLAKPVSAFVKQCFQVRAINNSGTSAWVSARCV
ncbi:fibronectin type III domain-containing protein [Frankia sp. CNm7]|uniref:fibronectin type III domain-containing protein n=1 Tax=Frankia nepalensis TaxID=1836974 RepID=UPI001931E4B7|nr:fibronectin type III domain-containing protein [Frankia nepalensis]MBL7522137.1 fibronectin type III domain-containing protein [Frankia nepalensis]